MLCVAGFPRTVKRIDGSVYERMGKLSNQLEWVRGGNCFVAMLEVAGMGKVAGEVGRASPRYREAVVV